MREAGMGTDSLKVTFECKKCGGTVLELPDDYTDDSVAKCKACGQKFGTYREIKAKAMEAAKSEVRTKFKEAFKGLKGWKVK
jgi:hypothetical protein